MTTKLTAAANLVARGGAEGRVAPGPAGWRSVCSSVGGTMRRLRLWLAATALTAVVACNTPSVPLPPPDLPSLGFISAGIGMVSVQGMPSAEHAGVRFYVYNISRGDGVITTAAANGSFTTSPFAGTDGDTVQLYYDTPATGRSQDVCVALHVGTPLLSVTCR
jgi:hypothetical protein